MDNCTEPGLYEAIVILHHVNNFLVALPGSLFCKVLSDIDLVEMVRYPVKSLKNITDLPFFCKIEENRHK